MGLLSGVGKAVGGVAKSIASPSGIGMIIGAALAAPTGGMSLAWGAALGGAAGNLAGGGNLKSAAMTGAMGYGLGSLATPALTSAAPTAPAAGAANPMGSGFTGTGPPVAGGIGNLQTGVGTQALVPDAAWGYGAPGGPPAGGIAPQGYTTAPTPDSVSHLGQAATAPAPPAIPPTTATEAPFWESDMMKYGLGGALLAGMFEDPNYDTVRSPDPKPSVVDQYYEDVAQYGEGNVDVPAELQPPPQSQLNTYGSKRLGAKGYAQGGAVDSEPAMLTPGEFVMTKKAVQGAGGSKRMYQLMDQLEQRGAR